MKECFEQAELLGKSAKRAGLKIATAESCTGGMIAMCLTEIAGSSVWFDCSFVTYCNEAKVAMLDVQERSIATYGVVSEPVAREMAIGALKHSSATLAVSVTGIAGPTGGTATVPVGTVCFGFAFRVNGEFCAESSTQHFEGSRSDVRRAACLFAIRTMRAILDV